MSEAEAEVSPYDLAQQVEGDCYLTGYIAIIKTITEEGEIDVRLAIHEMNNFEALGMLTVLLDRLRAENTVQYEIEIDDEEEDEE
jgi:hypothetical protein